jgi:proteasome lid subunit RPN8/RPN11
MAEAVKLPQAVYDDIIDHARAGHPEEICGIVRGNGLEATSSKRAENVAENRVIHYEVDSKTLLEFALHEDEMVGVYHSHPESPAYPSATDAWIAEYPNKIYFICSLEQFDAPVIRAFRMTTHYVDLDIPALREALSFYETRPNLFAYYQPDAEPPLALTDLAAEVGLPFYIVYYSEDGQEVDSRVVQVTEHPIEVVPNA